MQVQFKTCRRAPVSTLSIGADGLHSNVRKLAFGPQDRSSKRT